MTDQVYKYKIVRVSSVFKTSGTGSNFLVNLGNDDPMHKVIGVSIVNCTLLHSFYNITVANRRLRYISGAILYTLDLDDGFYTIDQVMTAIKDHYLANTGDTMVLTQDPITGLLSYTTTVSVDLLTAPDSTLAPSIGLTSSLGDVTAGTFSNTPNLQGVQNIYVSSPEINQGKSILASPSVFTDSILSIPVKVPYGGIITYESSGSDFIDRFDYIQSVDHGNINIRLMDDNNNELYYGENHPFTLVLKVYFE